MGRRDGGTVGWRVEGMDGRRDAGMEGMREDGIEGWRNRGKEGRRFGKSVGWRDGRKEGWRVTEEGRSRGLKDGGKEGRRDLQLHFTAKEHGRTGRKRVGRDAGRKTRETGTERRTTADVDAAHFE